MRPSRSFFLIALASIAVGASSLTPTSAQEEKVSDLVPTPAGYADRACVRTVAVGEVVTDDAPAGCTLHAPVPDDTPQPTSFVAWANTRDDSGFQSMSAKFVVPPAPAHEAKQILYIFPSLTGGANPPILQPVLQWGFNSMFGGNEWLLAAWYVGGSGVYAVTSAVGVNPGDVIQGSVVGSGGCDSGVCPNWTVTGTDLNQPASTVTLLVSTTRAHYVSAQGGVLEDYVVQSCDELPGGPLSFSEITLVDELGVTKHPKWALDTSTTKLPCGYAVTSARPSRVDITFSTLVDAGAD